MHYFFTERSKYFIDYVRTYYYVTGTLRFLGPTDFAAGEWAGIELDAAIGKNDGSVGEKRYFECRPKFGLFAPIHKVTKSPSNRMRKLSVTGQATPGRLCRQRSDLSEASNVSTVSRSTPSRFVVQHAVFACKRWAKPTEYSTTARLLQ